MSESITVAVVGAGGVAAELAKKSTQSDVTLFHRIQDDLALTVVEPTQYPEKFPPLLFALGLSDRAVLVANALDRTVAETAATLDLFDLPVVIRTGPAVGADEVGRAFKALRLATSPVAPLDLVRLRDEMGSFRVPRPAGPLSVTLDHYFPVKGVGTVALGFVRGAPLAAHASLRLYPLDKTVEVRSVQVHDVDVKEAAPGERVGVALRGVEVDELSRGQVLAPAGSMEVGTVLTGAEGRRCSYYRGDLVAGAQLQALVGLALVPAQVTQVGPGTVGLETDRPVAWRRGEAVVLSDLSAPQGPRCVGRWTLGPASG